MRRAPTNPFTVLLGVVGVAFTLTASAFCISVLRGVRPETSRQAAHGLDLLVSRWGTTALVVELALLAVATFGSIALDELRHREIRHGLRGGDARGREEDDRAPGKAP